jgi:hypothetical protein
MTSGLIKQASKHTFPQQRKRGLESNAFPVDHPPKIKKKKTMKTPVGYATRETPKNHKFYACVHESGLYRAV